MKLYDRLYMMFLSARSLRSLAHIYEYINMNFWKRNIHGKCHFLLFEIDNNNSSKSRTRNMDFFIDMKIYSRILKWIGLICYVFNQWSQ